MDLDERTRQSAAAAATAAAAGTVNERERVSLEQPFRFVQQAPLNYTNSGKSALVLDNRKEPQASSRSEAGKGTRPDPQQPDASADQQLSPPGTQPRVSVGQKQQQRTPEQSPVIRTDAALEAAGCMDDQRRSWERHRWEAELAAMRTQVDQMRFSRRLVEREVESLRADIVRLQKLLQRYLQDAVREAGPETWCTIQPATPQSSGRSASPATSARSATSHADHHSSNSHQQSLVGWIRVGNATFEGSVNLVPPTNPSAFAVLQCILERQLGADALHTDDDDDNKANNITLPLGPTRRRWKIRPACAEDFQQLINPAEWAWLEVDCSPCTPRADAQTDSGADTERLAFLCRNTTISALLEQITVQQRTVDELEERQAPSAASAANVSTNPIDIARSEQSTKDAGTGNDLWGSFGRMLSRWVWSQASAPDDDDDNISSQWSPASGVDAWPPSQPAAKATTDAFPVPSLERESADDGSAHARVHSSAMRAAASSPALETRSTAADKSAPLATRGAPEAHDSAMDRAHVSGEASESPARTRTSSTCDVAAYPAHTCSEAPEGSSRMHTSRVVSSTSSSSLVSLPPAGATTAVTAPATATVTLAANFHSQVLSPDHFESLRNALPHRYRDAVWCLVYSTAIHGASLYTFYHRTQHASQSVVAVRDRAGHVFGAFVTETWRSNASTFYGTGECFVFRADAQGHVEPYPWTGKNTFFQYSGPRFIAVGGGAHFALSLDDALLSGTSGYSETFDNPPLCLDAPANEVSLGEFECVVLEVWGWKP